MEVRLALAMQAGVVRFEMLQHILRSQEFAAMRALVELVPTTEVEVAEVQVVLELAVLPQQMHQQVDPVLVIQ